MFNNIEQQQCRECGRSPAYDICAVDTPFNVNLIVCQSYFSIAFHFMQICFSTMGVVLCTCLEENTSQCKWRILTSFLKIHNGTKVFIIVKAYNTSLVHIRVYSHACILLAMSRVLFYLRQCKVTHQFISIHLQLSYQSEINSYGNI